MSFQKLLDGNDDHYEIETIPYDIECDMDIFNNYDEWFDVFTISEKRVILIENGIHIATEIYPSFMETYKNENDGTNGIGSASQPVETDCKIGMGEEEKGEKEEKEEK